MIQAVQTLWTAGKRLTDDSFGWKHPKYHLMSWALSCLELRQTYDSVVLYADSAAAQVLADKMGLPYTDVKACYDHLPVSPRHWSYAKIMTYKDQSRPFLHIDGDVFLPRALSKGITEAGLVVQNRENVTSYYRDMFDKILCQFPIHLPEYLSDALRSTAPVSYNAGVFGGSDIHFIQRYCDEVAALYRDNGLYDTDKSLGNGFNVLSEQVLFAALASAERKHVTTVLDTCCNDNGHRRADFCNFRHYDTNTLMHIIGGHKRNDGVCAMIEKTLIRKYPQYYQRLMAFIGTAAHDNTPKLRTDNATLTPNECMATYRGFKDCAMYDWGMIPESRILHTLRMSASFTDFLNADEEERQSYVIKRNPMLKVYHIDGTWCQEARQTMASRLNAKVADDIGLLPTLHGGISETAIGDWGHNIMALLDRPMRFAALLRAFSSHADFPTGYDVEPPLLREMEYLLYHGVIIAVKANNNN